MNTLRFAALPAIAMLVTAAFLIAGCTSVAEIRTHHDASGEVIAVDADNPS